MSHLNPIPTVWSIDRRILLIYTETVSEFRRKSFPRSPASSVTIRMISESEDDSNVRRWDNAASLTISISFFLSMGIWLVKRGKRKVDFRKKKLLERIFGRFYGSNLHKICPFQIGMELMSNIGILVVPNHKVQTELSGGKKTKYIEHGACRPQRPENSSN